jgi:hypothetical protein
MAFGIAEFSRKKCLNKLPSEHWTKYPRAQAHNAHVIILYPLMSGEGIPDQRRPHAGHLVGCNASPYPAAADGQPRGTSPLATALGMSTTKPGSHLLYPTHGIGFHLHSVGHASRIVRV